MASAEFERFRFSFFEDKNSARDGLATAALAQLQGEEAARAEEMLIGLLPDARAVIGLGILRSRRAEPELTRPWVRLCFIRPGMTDSATAHSPLSLIHI